MACSPTTSWIDRAAQAAIIRRISLDLPCGIFLKPPHSRPEASPMAARSLTVISNSSNLSRRSITQSQLVSKAAADIPEKYHRESQDHPSTTYMPNRFPNVSGSHISGGLDDTSEASKAHPILPMKGNLFWTDDGGPFLRKVLGGEVALATKDSCSHELSDFSTMRKEITASKTVLCKLGFYMC